MAVSSISGLRAVTFKNADGYQRERFQDASRKLVARDEDAVSVRLSSQQPLSPETPKVNPRPRVVEAQAFSGTFNPTPIELKAPPAEQKPITATPGTPIKLDATAVVAEEVAVKRPRP